MPMANKKLYAVFSFLIILIILAVSFPYVQTYASTPQKVKIGLFYGTGAKDSYTVTTQDGINVALANDDGSVSVFTDSSISNVTVKKNTYFSAEYNQIFPDFQSASEKANELRAEGQTAYCSVTGNIYSVRVGTYATFEEAQAASPVFGNTTVKYPSKGVLILHGDEILIATDDANRYTEISGISGNISLNSVPYRGAIRFIRNDANDMAAVNVLGLEEYLYSVVPKEVSASWNEEVLKAQAVAARTFTVTNLNKFAKYGFNLDNTTASQVYGGVNAEHSRTTAAVDATKGEIVLYDGKPASIYYHATSGGRTANSEDVWTAALPYLRSVEDSYENPAEATYARWDVTFTKEELKNTLSGRGVNIGEIEDVTVKYSDGHAIELTFKGTSGSKTYTKDNIRVPLSLKSTNFTLIKNGGKAEPKYYFTNYAALSKNKLNSVGGFASAYAGKLATNNGGVAAVTQSEPISYTFSGGGWGHGVGMSQWGAKGMADNGFNYKEILTHYFTGVQVDIY